MPGLTLDEFPAFVMSIVQGAEAEPQVLAAVQRLAGSGSSQAYLLFARAAVVSSTTIQMIARAAFCFFTGIIFPPHLKCVCRSEYWFACKRPSYARGPAFRESTSR